jgi:hypothetical protein
LLPISGGFFKYQLKYQRLDPSIQASLRAVEVEQIGHCTVLVKSDHCKRYRDTDVSN